ncbi:MAG: GAF domain-containing SpoIIE family protein phosphatase [Planctomycetales bacterium]
MIEQSPPVQEPLERQLAGAMKLVEVTCELAREHGLDRILNVVTRGVCEALACERATLYLFDEEAQELVTRVATELEIEEIRSPIDRGITGWVARRRMIANIPDPAVDARWNSAIDRRTGFQTRSILAAPVVSRHEERLLGVLQALNKKDGPFDGFDEKLIEAFASHAATALERAELIEDVRRAHELHVSVEMGRNIQAAFLPSRLPSIPGYEVAAWWQPAEAVGGDYYDLLQLPDGKLGLVVADVSGHGVGASLIMASVRAMLHVMARTRSEPEEIVSLLSQSISADLHEGRFITFLLVALDAARHQLTYANAGHGPALHFCRETRRFRTLESTAMPIGFAEDPRVPRGATVEMRPGDLLLLATDGAIELRDARDAMFGRERLERLIAENCTLPAAQLMNVLREAITRFNPHDDPPDDVTLLLVERKWGHPFDAKAPSP